VISLDSGEWCALCVCLYLSLSSLTLFFLQTHSSVVAYDVASAEFFTVLIYHRWIQLLLFFLAVDLFYPIKLRHVVRVLLHLGSEIYSESACNHVRTLLPLVGFGFGLIN
jgi:hypothetical protein